MKVDYSLIPERIMNNIIGYVEGKEALGGFLYAIFTNDLFKAVSRADEEMRNLIPLIVMYVYWECPGCCWGSEEIVKTYMSEKRKNELRKKNEI